MRINEKGYWENTTAEGHEHDEGLAKALIDYLKSVNCKSVLDLGCGIGYYSNLINRAGIFCKGVDGNPFTPELTNYVYSVADLSIPQDFGKYNWVLSLEVGEHIPQEYQDTFISNLHNHNRDGIILSWAVRGQGGDGHVNCLDNVEVIRKIVPMGYEYDDKTSVKFKSHCAEYPKPCYWFRDTLMVFRKV